MAERLNTDRVVAAAIAFADENGVESLSMRKLAQTLGVDPMSLYNHVVDKGALLDGMVDAVIAQIVPVTEGEWSAALRGTILSARATMLQHPWAAHVIESRQSATPAAMRHIDTVLDIVRGGGFSIALGHHTLHVLGSRILGFSQDLFDDNPDVRPSPEIAELQARAMAATHPRLSELALAADHDGGLGGCDDDDEFAFALDLLIEGLERRRAKG
jgi:AcrR family transcriptional regulator